MTLRPKFMVALPLSCDPTWGSGFQSAKGILQVPFRLVQNLGTQPGVIDDSLTARSLWFGEERYDRHSHIRLVHSEVGRKPLSIQFSSGMSPKGSCERLGPGWHCWKVLEALRCWSGA